MTTAILVSIGGLLITWLLAFRVASVPRRQLLLLAASYLFYAGWDPRFLPLLVLSSLGNYACGRFLRRHPTPGRLWIGLGFNLGLLLFFKYLPPLAGASAGVGGLRAHLAGLALPTGISFWTFQAMSYLLDLYRGEALDPTLPELCLYLAFWPTVLSGPICRLPELLPQFREARRPTGEEAAAGAQRLGIGILMVAAGQVLGGGLRPGAGLEGGFARAGGWGGLDVWCLAFGFGFQLFFDFAGYSHIVIGAARLFGFSLQENFARPYLATTPSLFWTRWHMSLSFWIRDYLFLPLATLRRDPWWRYVALLLSMVAFGLWHQASLPFLCWGAYQGLLLVGHRAGQHLGRRWHGAGGGPLGAGLGWAVTLLAVMLGWIFFRARDLGQAAAMLGAALRPSAYAHRVLDPSLYALTMGAVIGYFALVAAGATLDRVAAADRAGPGPGPRLLAAVARDRWAWVTPAGLILGFYFFVALHFRQAGAGTTAFLYRGF